MPNVKVQMPKGKIQITDDGFRTTSTKLTDTDHGHGHESWSEGTTVFPYEEYLFILYPKAYENLTYENGKLRTVDRFDVSKFPGINGNKAIELST